MVTTRAESLMRLRPLLQWPRVVAVLLLAGSVVAVSARATTLNVGFNGSQPFMPQRVFRDGTPSTCNMFEPFPGTFDSPAEYETFEFCNNGPELCVTVTYDGKDCGSSVHLLGYLNAFDPFDLPENFVGDIGASESQPFSFIVPANQHFLVVAQTNFGMTACHYGFTTNGLLCPAPAPALSRSAVLFGVVVLVFIGWVAVRRRHSVSVLAMSTLLIALFAVPLPADPPPTACELGCGAAYRECAKTSCDSEMMDKDPGCLMVCEQAYQACTEACAAQ